MNELLQFLMNPPPAPSLDGISLAFIQALLPFLPAIASGLGGLFGGGGGSNSRTQQSTERGSIFDQGNINSFFADPRAQQFSGNLFSQFENQLGRDLPVNQQAISDFGLARAGAVNRGFEGAENNLQASLAGRGLNFSPGPQGVGFGNLAAARGGALADVGGDIARLRFELPQMQELIRQQRLAQASQFLQFQPRGQSTDNTRTLDLTRTGDTQGQQQQGNRFTNALGGFIGALPAGGRNSISDIPIDIPDLSGTPFPGPRFN